MLLIDEVLGVDDHAFYLRCLEKIRCFQSAGKTIVLASHSSELVTMLCQKALWIERGQVIRQGLAGEVVAAYEATMK